MFPNQPLTNIIPINVKLRRETSVGRLHHVTLRLSYQGVPPRHWAEAPSTKDLVQAK